MANFNIPNLCGASEELNAASSKIADLEAQIASQIDAVASAAASAIDTALADVKAGLDGLAVDIPETPNVNFQAELTSLVSDFNLSTPQGILQYTSKLAQLEDQFGDALTKAGKSLDSVIADATAAISGGGDVCAVAPNLELPANGEVVEKSQAVKTATADPLTEEVSIVIKNVKSEEANATSQFNSLIKKFNDATTAGIPSDGIDNAFSKLTSTLQSDEFKEQMAKDFATAKAEYAKIAQDPLKYKTITVPQAQVSATTDNKTTLDKGTTKTVRTVKATTTEDRNTIVTDSAAVSSKPKTEKTVVSENGFLPRKIKITEYFKDSAFDFFASGNPNMERISNDPRYKEDSAFGGGENPIVTLKKEPFTIDKIVGSNYVDDNLVAIFFYLNGDATDILPSINGKKLILESGPRPSRDVRGNLQTYDFGTGQGSQVQGIADINVLQVTYTVLEKIDPNFKG